MSGANVILTPPFLRKGQGKDLLFCLCAFVCICVFALLLLAAAGTVAPDSDNTTGSWSTTPLWEKIDEDIDSPDAATITSPNNPSSPANDIIFEVTCPSDVGTITAANLRVRARKSAAAGREIQLAVSWSATAATNFNTGNLTDTLANYASGNQAGLSISKATCNASTLKIAPTTTGSGAGRQAVVDTLNLDITYDIATGRRRVVIARREHSPLTAASGMRLPSSR